MKAVLGEWFDVPNEDDWVHLLRVLGNGVELAGRRLRVKDMVGHVGLPSGDVCSLTSPKATSASVVAWIAYLDSSMSDIVFRDEASFGSEDEDVGALLARLFAVEVCELVRTRGLLRRYSRVNVSSGVIRGRILFDELAARACDISVTPCEAFERINNTALNRFLAAVTRMIGIDSVLRRGCGGYWPRLNDAVAGIEPRIDQRLAAGDFAFDRLDEPYRNACRIGRMLLRFSGLGDSSNQRSFSFLIPVNSLFENTVVKAFKEAGFSVQPKFNMSCKRFRVSSDGDMAGVAPDARFQGDLLVEIDRGQVVVDAKFKTWISPDCYYQVVSYCLLQGATEAILVFPNCGEAQSTTFFPVAWAGGSQTIRVHALHLATDGRTVSAWKAAGADLVRRFSGVIVRAAKQEGNDGF